jgi:hypothetical protein
MFWFTRQTPSNGRRRHYSFDSSLFHTLPWSTPSSGRRVNYVGITTKRNEQFGGSFRIERIRIEDVEQDGEEGAGRVDAQRHPPDELLVQFLLEILEDEKANGQAGQGAGQVGHVRDGRTQLLGCVPVVDGESDVSAGCKKFEKKFENWRQNF